MGSTWTELSLEPRLRYSPGPPGGTMELETSQQKGDEAGTLCARRRWPKRDVYSSTLALGLWNQIAWAQIPAVPLSAVGLQAGYWIYLCLSFLISKMRITMVVL
uniref:Uncharacterized protein n=1 Tax=Mustela putorius furo TaxID=9669 RepID=M3YRK4_MUSPF